MKYFIALALGALFLNSNLLLAGEQKTPQPTATQKTTVFSDSVQKASEPVQKGVTPASTPVQKATPMNSPVQKYAEPVASPVQKTTTYSDPVQKATPMSSPVAQKTLNPVAQKATFGKTLSPSCICLTQEEWRLVQGIAAEQQERRFGWRIRVTGMRNRLGRLLLLRITLPI